MCFQWLSLILIYPNAVFIDTLEMFIGKAIELGCDCVIFSESGFWCLSAYNSTCAACRLELSMKK